MTSKGLEKSTPFAKLLCRLSEAFRKAGIPYMIFGGQAVLIYGEPRFTQDIDVTVGVGPQEAGVVLAVIKKLKLQTLVDRVAEFLSETFVLPVREPKSGIRIDIVFALSGFEQEAIESAVEVSISGKPVKFVRREDLLILKTIAGRPRDIEDIAGILAKKKLSPSSLKHVLFWLQAYDRELDQGFESKFLEVFKSSKKLH